MGNRKHWDESSEDPPYEMTFGPADAFRAVRRPAGWQQLPRVKPRRNGRVERELLARLKEAGRRASLNRDDLLIDGHRVPGLRPDLQRWRWPEPSKADRRRYLDALVMTFLGDWFQSDADKHVRAVRAELSTARGGEVLHISHDGEVIATLRPTGLTPANRHGTLFADFLSAGEHWHAAVERALLPMRERPTVQHVEVAEKPTQPIDGDLVAPSITEMERVPVLSDWPADAPAHLREMAVAASARLRANRRAAYRVPVQVRRSSVVLHLEPVRTRHGNRELPFSAASAEGVLRGVLCLEVLGNPLPLIVQRRDPGVSLPEVWATLLEVCAYWFSTVPRSPDATAPPEYPAAFQPDPQTHHQLAHPVKGFVRRLPGEQRPGLDRAQLAMKEGIVLPPGTTFVQPHLRGEGHVEVHRFDWKGPARSAQQQESDAA